MSETHWMDENGGLRSWFELVDEETEELDRCDCWCGCQALTYRGTCASCLNNDHVPDGRDYADPAPSAAEGEEE